ncbi:unnamed protein product [Peronospora belbahrii]|uniref:Integrase catalytic domain-containing protein n=1 Tax=Peronospora belbahrii TaxID=622444 RepID=A0ABN8D3A0_9STRA|nr:unnamed protein product [Peronospora belbahrii]
MAFADLSIPGSKTEGEVNMCMMQYIAWEERQRGSQINEVISRDYDTEDHNEGAEPVEQVGPSAYQLNLVERTHQTLIGMVKTMMHQSGLPKSFWSNAFETAVYVKNRVYCKGAGRTPYEIMFRTKPDLHHIRAFGSLAFCHVPKSKWKKFLVNCRMGFLIGYREDVVGCHIYFPTEHKTGDDIDDFTGEDDDEGLDISSHVEFPTGSSNLSSNVDMESVASELPDSPDMWRGRLRSRVPPAEPVDTVQKSATSNNAFEETQEGENAGTSSQPVAKSSSSEQGDECITGDLSVNDDSRDDALSIDLHDTMLDDESTDDEIAADNDFAESVGHVTEMSAVIRTESSLSELEDYDHLFDPGDQLEIESDEDVGALVSATQNVLTIMPKHIIGHTHLARHRD